MATFISRTQDSKLFLRLDVNASPNTVNILTNTSKVNWQLYIGSSDNIRRYHLTNSLELIVDIDNSRVRNENNRSFDVGGQMVMLSSGEEIIAHSNNGSKVIPVRALFNTGSWGWIDVQGTFEMPVIPRVSDYTFRTPNTNNVGGNNFFIGENPYLEINRKSDEFLDYVYFYAGNEQFAKRERLSSQRGNIVFTESEVDKMYQLLNNTTGRICKFLIRTAKNDVIIGEQWHEFILLVPDSVRPTISSAVIRDTNSKVTQLGQGVSLSSFSTFKAIASGVSGTKHSTISEVIFKFGGATKKGILSNGQYTADFDVLHSGGQYTMTVIARDSRGRETFKNVVHNVIDYKRPSIKLFEPMRNANGTGTTGLARMSIEVTSIRVGNEDKNRFTFRVFAQAVGSQVENKVFENYSNAPKQINTFTFSGTFDTAKSYQFRLEVEDRFTTQSALGSFGTSQQLMVWGKRTVGIGGFPNESLNAPLQVHGNIMMNGRLLLDTFYPVGSIYQTVVDVNPSSFMGGTWVKFAQGRVLIGHDPSNSLFNTVGKQGGSLSHSHNAGTLEALVGSAGGRADTIAYKASNKNATPRPTYAISGGVHGIGGNNAHNTEIVGSTDTKYNLPPYEVVYHWKRIS